MRWVDFFLGIMLFKLYDKRRNMHLGGWSEMLAVVLLIAALWAYPYVDAKVRNAPLYWLVLIPMIVVFAQQKGPVSRLLQHRTLQWLAQLSMPIFLLHPIVFRAMFHFFPTLPEGGMLALCIVVVVGMRLLLRAFGWYPLPLVVALQPRRLMKFMLVLLLMLMQ